MNNIIITKLNFEQFMDKENWQGSPIAAFFDVNNGGITLTWPAHKGAVAYNVILYDGGPFSTILASKIRVNHIELNLDES